MALSLKPPSKHCRLTRAIPANGTRRRRRGTSLSPIRLLVANLRCHTSLRRHKQHRVTMSTKTGVTNAFPTTSTHHCYPHGACTTGKSLRWCCDDGQPTGRRRASHVSQTAKVPSRQPDWRPHMAPMRHMHLHMVVGAPSPDCERGTTAHTPRRHTLLCLTLSLAVADKGALLHGLHGRETAWMPAATASRCVVWERPV